MTRPSWLPEPLDFATDFSGNWDDFLEASYGIFETDLITGAAYYHGKKVILSRNYPDLGDGKHPSYWHIVSTGDGKTESSKVADPKRMEVVGWIKPVLENCPDSDLLEWKAVRSNSKRRGNTRTVVWCKKHKFVIFLKELDYVYVILSAYKTGYPGTIRDLNTEYNQFLAEQSQE